jgi:hypothetical protein
LLQTSVITRGARVVLTVHATPFRQIEHLSARSISGIVRSSRAPPPASL